MEQVVIKRGFFKVLIIRVGTFSSEIIDEFHLAPNADVDGFLENYRGRDSIVAVKIPMGM